MEGNMLERGTWEFINSFAPWLSAVGVISAVLVSLHLARRDKNIRLEVSAGHRLIATPGEPGPYPEYLIIHVVNIGHRDAQLINIGWKVGIFKKRYAVQTISHDGMSSQLPVRLKDGEEAKYLIPLGGEPDWLRDFAEKMMQPFPKLQGYLVKVQAFTSVGDTFESRIEKGLRKKFNEAING